MAQREVIEKIRQYIQLLNKNGLLVSRAFLFGSYARNQAHQNSDIDVMLISDSIDYNNHKVIGKIWTLANMIDSNIEPTVITSKKYLQDDYTPLYENIRREGIEIKA